jgi:hypothetical protein
MVKDANVVDNDPPIHSEKPVAAQEPLSSGPEDLKSTDGADIGGRRKSVAVNVVENPLTVRSSDTSHIFITQTQIPVPRSPFITGEVNSFKLLTRLPSAFPPTRLSLMPGASPRRMA